MPNVRNKHSGFSRFDSRKLEASSYHEPKIAVWWYIDREIHGEAEAYNYDGPGITNIGGNIQLDVDHMKLWSYITRTPELKKYESLPYETFPRGRVIYNSWKKLFIVVTSKRLISDVVFKKKIKYIFNLPETVTFEADEHYEPVEEVDLNFSAKDREAVVELMERFGISYKD